MHGKKSEVKNLLAYIQGIRKGKTAHDLEREAMQDPFLQDALDGYDLVNGDHSNNIKRLQNQILKKTEKRKSYTSYYYIAASVLILFFIGSYFLLYNSDKENQAIVYQSTSKERVAIAISSENKKNENISTEELTKNANRKKVHDNSFMPKNKDKLNIYEEHKNQNAETQNIAFEDNSKYLEHPLSAEGMTQKDITIRSSPFLARSVAKEESSDFPTKDTSINYSENADMVLESKKTDEILLADKKSSKIKNNNKRDNRELLSGSVNIASADQPVYDASPVIGEKLYNKYLKDHVLLSKENICNSSKGDINVCFSVSDSGRPYNIEVIKSLCPKLDEKIIELIKNGSDWKGKRGIVQFTQ